MMQPTETSSQPAPEPGQAPAPSSHAALLTVFLVVFIDLLGFGIVLPLLPLYADDLLVPLFPGEDNAFWRGLLLGLLMSSFSAMQFVFAPMWGRLSDRVGRRPILLLGLSGSVVFYALFGIASEVGLGEGGWPLLGLILVFLSRLGAGVAGATIGTAQAVIADTTAPERRARGMALIGAAFGIGFTFGPLLGFASLFVPLAGAPGYLAAALSLAAFLFGLSRLPETRRGTAPAGLRRRIFDWPGFLRVIRTPTVGLLVLTFFLATFAFGGLESTLALVNRLLLTGEELTRQELASRLTRQAARTLPTERINFLIFAYVGLVLMLVQGLVYRRLVHRVGEVRFLRAGLVFMTLGLIGAVLVLVLRTDLDRAPLLACGLAVMTLAVVGFALLTPSVQSLVSRRSDPSRQGEVLGVNQSAAALARILGPLLGLSLFYALPSHILPYAFGTVLLIGVFVLSLRIDPATSSWSLSQEPEAHG
jgi:MFS family permease